MQYLQILSELEKTIQERKEKSDKNSYTASLLNSGVSKCAQKLGEEAVETIIAALNGETKEVASEAADLLYHLLVTLAATNVSFYDVLEQLKKRQGTSGIIEKASRPPKEDS